MQRHRNPMTRDSVLGVLAVSVAFAGVAAYTSSAEAQSGRSATLEEVVVTAQKREESLQEIPIAITAMDTSTLEAIGVTDIGGLTGFVPGLVIQPTIGGSVNAAVTIRGAGQTTNNLSRDASVGLYIDGVPISKSSGALFDGVDIERMEVLRGPQGTLYGKNTISGAINIISQKPSGELGGYVTIGAGNKRLRTLRTSLDLPALGQVGEGLGQLSTKISYIRRMRDGFFKNDYPGLKDFDNKDQWGARFAATWDITTRLRLDYAYDKFVLDQRPTMASQYTPGGKRPRHISADSALRSDVKVEGHALTASYELGEVGMLGDMTLKSITAYRELETRSLTDFDGSPLDLFRFIIDNNFEQRSQELQLIGSADQLDYVMGLFYYDEEWDTYNPRWLLQEFHPGSNNYNYDSRGSEVKSYAAYTQVTWRPSILDNRLELTGGIRWTRDEKDSWRLMQNVGTGVGPGPFIDPGKGPLDPAACVCLRDPVTGMPVTWSGLPASTAIPGGLYGPTDLVPLKTSDSWSKVTPMAVVSYHVTDSATAYLKYSTGFKSGGINGVAETNADFIRGFGQETMKSYELGWKSRMLDNRLQLNAAAFYNKYDDIQVNTFVPNMIGISVQNAGKATISGLELETLARVTSNLDLSLNYAYLHTRYDKYVDGGVDVSHEREFPYAPRHSYNVGVVYTSDPMAWGTLSARLDYNWLGKQYIGVMDDPTTNIDSYGLVNARVTLADIPAGGRGTMAVSLWGKNLEDKEYTTSGVNLQALTVNQWGDPRSYGLEFTYRY